MSECERERKGERESNNTSECVKTRCRDSRRYLAPRLQTHCVHLFTGPECQVSAPEPGISSISSMLYISSINSSSIWSTVTECDMRKVLNLGATSSKLGTEVPECNMSAPEPGNHTPPQQVLPHHRAHSSSSREPLRVLRRDSSRISRILYISSSLSYISGRMLYISSSMLYISSIAVSSIYISSIYQ